MEKENETTKNKKGDGKRSDSFRLLTLPKLSPRALPLQSPVAETHLSRRRVHTSHSTTCSIDQKPYDDETTDQHSRSCEAFILPSKFEESIDTLRVKAEIERDHYKNEMEKKEKEIKEYQQEIMKLKVVIRKRHRPETPSNHVEREHYQAVEAQKQELTDELTKLKQEATNQKEKLLMVINDQFMLIKDFQRGDNSVKVMDAMIAEKSMIINKLKNQMEDAASHLNEAIIAVNTKQIALQEQNEKLMITKVERDFYREDFEREKKDKEDIKLKLDVAQSEILALKLSPHNNDGSNNDNKSERLKAVEEENDELKTRIIKCTEECNALKKNFILEQSKCKLLEDHLNEMRNRQLSSSIKNSLSYTTHDNRYFDTSQGYESPSPIKTQFPKHQASDKSLEESMTFVTDEKLKMLQEEQQKNGAIADRELEELDKLKEELAERKPLPSPYEELINGGSTAEDDEDELLDTFERNIEIEVFKVSHPPSTAEVMREDDDSSLPYDPNLVCPKCGKQYRIGQIQYLRRHLQELCPLLKHFPTKFS